MYVLNLSEEKRVLSCGKAQEDVDYINMVLVETAPDTSNGQWTRDYYYIDGEYIYDPVERPEPIEPEPSSEEILNALLGVE